MIGMLVAAIMIHSPVFTHDVPFTIRGTASPRQVVEVTIEPHASVTAVADEHGRWQAEWVAPLETGIYEVRSGEAIGIVRVQGRGRLPRTPEIDSQVPAPRERFEDVGENVELINRWRIDTPPYELNVPSRGPLDPYNRNILKGDLPLGVILSRGVGEGTPQTAGGPSRSAALRMTLEDVFLVLTGVSDSLAEAGQEGLFMQNIILSADLYQGQTTFQPVQQRIKFTVAASARVADGIRGRLSVQELFYERKLRDLSVNYDFVSFRAGVQPFVSDFRGFIFADSNPGFRLFGNFASNRYQYNVAIFDRVAKQGSTGLNRFERLRDQRVAVANVYIQDFIRSGFTQQASIHHLADDDLHATYLGAAGFGHFGVVNAEYAAYSVFGQDRGESVGTGMVAAEVSMGRDWMRPRLGFLYAGRGFDSIHDSAAFAGGGFSFFNRFTSTSKERGSLFPSGRSVDGRPNYDNPGLTMLTAGVDLDITPRLRAVVTASRIRDFGTDLSIGARYRPFLNNHMVISGGVATLIAEEEVMHHVFTNVVVQF